MSPMPDEMVMTFFTWPLRMSGKNTLNKWTLPMTFVLNAAASSFSRAMGSSAPLCVQCPVSH